MEDRTLRIRILLGVVLVVATFFAIQLLSPTVPNREVRRQFSGIEASDVRECRLVGPAFPHKVNPVARKYFLISSQAAVEKILDSLKQSVSKRGDSERSYEGDTIGGLKFYLKSGEVLEVRFGSSPIGRRLGFGEKFAETIEPYILAAKSGRDHD